MKTSIISLLVTAILASTNVLAAPSSLETKDVAAADLAAIAATNCFHRSTCSISWSGKGEQYCDGRGYSHMTRDDCGWNKLRQRVCCIVKDIPKPK